MWLDFPRDRWAGFPKERERLLNFLAANGIKNVYLLAGDLHTAHAVRADLRGPQNSSLPLWEFCSSPFEQTPNAYSSRSYWPLRTKSVKSTQLFFCLRQHNFGVVHVDFSTPDCLEVKFQVYGDTGELLGEVNDFVAQPERASGG